jgi:uncharacterized protein
MEMLGNRALAASPQQVWDALNDPAVLKACIPGCDKFEATEPNQYAVGTQLKIGPVAAKFSGKVQVSDIEPPNSYVIAFEGQGGAAGFGKGSSKVSLSPLALLGGASGTQLSYTVNATVGGKIAQLGQRLIDGASKLVADDFFKRFEASLIERHPELAQISVATENVATKQDGTPATPGFDSKTGSEGRFGTILSNVLRDLSGPPFTYIAAGGVGAAIMAAILFFALG